MLAPKCNAGWLSSLPQAAQAEFLDSLSQQELLALQFDWQFWARTKQITPPGNWNVWLNLAGRGYGKTRVGCEWVREQIEAGACKRIAIVAPTAADCRKVIVEGESGILAISPPWFRPRYEPSRRQITWPNGAIAILYSAEEPERLRGPQHDGALCDELGAWKYPQEVWDQLQFTMRLGAHPRQVITTTPRPIPVLKSLVARALDDPGDVVLTRGSTYENAHLAKSFVETIVARYAGTRLGRQELEAEILDDVPGALWSRARIDELRIGPDRLPALRRIVVAIDPAVSTSEGSDETGIICAGLGEDGHGYILEDRSGRYSPNEWAKEAIALYRARNADRIVGEVNQGGDLVESTLRMVDVNIPFTAVHAAHGKAVRAEPVSALYEQKLVHHVGSLPQLEDQLCIFTADYDRRKAKFSPDRMDALVWALTELKVRQSPGWGFLEFARRQADATKTPGTNINKVEPTTQLKAPPNISTVYGLSGRAYTVGPDGVVEVITDDAKPLLGQGFKIAQPVS
jgi:phage terminase large subunit-like protein